MSKRKHSVLDERPSKKPLKSPIRSPIKSSIKSPIRSPIRSPIKSSIKSSIRTPIRSPIKSSIKSPIRSPIKSPIGKYQSVSYDPFDSLSYRSSDQDLYYQTIRDLNAFLQPSLHNGGIFMVIYLNIEKRDVMIPVFFTDEQFVSDCKHDFDGKRGDKKRALNVRETVCEFFDKGKRGDDKRVLNRLNNILDIEKDNEVMYIRGPNKHIEDVLMPQINKYNEQKNKNDRERNETPYTVFSIGSERYLKGTELLNRRAETANLDIDPTFLKKAEEEEELVTAEKREATEEMEKIDDEILKERFEKFYKEYEESKEEEVNEEYNTLTLLDQGISKSFLSSNSNIKASLIQDMYDKNTNVENSNNIFHEFCVGFFVLNKRRYVPVDALFLKHVLDKGHIKMNKTFFNGTSISEYNGQPSISELLNSSLRPMQIAMAKFAGDHVAQITNIIKFFGKSDSTYTDNGKQSFIFPFTHDTRSFLDSYKMNIILRYNSSIIIQEYKFPTIFSRVIEYKGPKKTNPIRLSIVVIPKEESGIRRGGKKSVKRSNRKSKPRRNRTRKSHL